MFVEDDCLKCYAKIYLDRIIFEKNILIGTA